MRRLPIVLFACACCTALSCSLKTIALKSVADAMSGSGTVYARDDDPELVRDSVPFAIKTMEQILDSLPEHAGLLLGLTRTCTQYGVAFIEEDADRLEEKDVAQARVTKARAKRLFLRARGYGLRGFELAAPGAKAALFSGDRSQQAHVLGQMNKEQVPLLFWTAAAWASAISVAKDDLALVGDLPTVEAIMRRALALDESFDEGSLHEFFLVYEAGQGNAPAAKEHYRRAVALSKNKKLAPDVSYAEDVCVPAQDKKEFKRLLERTLAFDVDSDPDHRLVNLIAQRRARWLLSRTNDLFAQ